MDKVKVAFTHSERATPRVGDVFLKVGPDQARIEVDAMAMAPVPTPEVLWRKPPVPAELVEAADCRATGGFGAGGFR